MQVAALTKIVLSGADHAMTRARACQSTVPHLFVGGDRNNNEQQKCRKGPVFQEKNGSIGSVVALSRDKPSQGCTEKNRSTLLPTAAISYFMDIYGPKSTTRAAVVSES